MKQAKAFYIRGKSQDETRTEFKLTDLGHFRSLTVRQRAKLDRRALLGPGLCGIDSRIRIEQVPRYIREQEGADGNSGQL